MPTITVLGWVVRLPFVERLDQLPLVSTLRDPYRIGVGAMFGLAILAGVAFAECARHIEHRFAARHLGVVRGLAAGMLVLSSAGFWFARPELGALPLSAPYPLSAAVVPDSPIMDVLRRPGGPILQLPVDAPFVDQLALHARAM